MTANNTGSTQLSQILTQMNEKGNFPVSIVTDQHGFSIASAADPDQDPDTQAAVVALVQKTANQASNQLGMAQTDEISLYDTAGRRLICRPFTANDHALILAVVIPDKRQSYRHLTNQAVKTIKKQWRL